MIGGDVDSDHGSGTPKIASGCRFSASDLRLGGLWSLGESNP